MSEATAILVISGGLIFFVLACAALVFMATRPPTEEEIEAFSHSPLALIFDESRRNRAKAARMVATRKFRRPLRWKVPAR